MNDMLTAAEAAQFLNLTEAYLANTRTAPQLFGGPPFIKKPGQRPSVFYERDVLVAYREAREAGLDPRSAREVVVTLTAPGEPHHPPEQVVVWHREDGVTLKGPYGILAREAAQRGVHFPFGGAAPGADA